ADFGAQPADVGSELRVPTHECRGSPAGLRTVPVQSDAFGHLLDILLAQAGVGAMLARLGALDTGFDTGCVLFVCHERFSLSRVAIEFTLRELSGGRNRAKRVPIRAAADGSNFLK